MNIDECCCAICREINAMTNDSDFDPVKLKLFNITEGGECVTELYNAGTSYQDITDWTGACGLRCMGSTVRQTFHANDVMHQSVFFNSPFLMWNQECIM
jgi:hypothetical protein